MSKVTKTILGLLFLLLVGIGGLYLEATFFAPNRLTLREESIVDQRIPESSSIFQVAYISDFHYNQFMDQAKLDKMIQLINQQAVDVILFGGDLISDLNAHPLSSEQQSQLLQGLDQLSAPLGKFAILGDGDLESEYSKTLSSSLLTKADFEILDNQIIQLVNHEQQPILRLIGINQQADSELKSLTQELDDSLYTLLISHKASQLSLVDASAIDLLLSGHTHGGQINVPLLRDTYLGLEIHTKPTQIVKTTRIDVSNGVSQRIENRRLFSNPQVSIYSFKSK